jgi:hypothetical protein
MTVVLTANIILSAIIVVAIFSTLARAIGISRPVQLAGTKGRSARAAAAREPARRTPGAGRFARSEA